MASLAAVGRIFFRGRSLLRYRLCPPPLVLHSMVLSLSLSLSSFSTICSSVLGVLFLSLSLSLSLFLLLYIYYLFPLRNSQPSSVWASGGHSTIACETNVHYKSPDRILPEWAIQPWSPSTEREKERKSESESEREREREGE